jgi:protein phosphatase
MSDLPVPGQPVILFAEECDRGAIRAENQDSVLHVRIALGDLLIVADGIGGYTGGAIASRMVVENFYAHLASLPQDYPADNALREAAARANASIVMAANAPNSPYEQMGSTVVVALLQQEGEITNACIGHIGDSRAYLLRADRIHRLTTDHSAVQSLLNRGLISAEEVEQHPDASVLTRCLGHHPEVEIEIEQLPLAVGDTLLLCSDGLWGFVPEQEMEEALATPTVEGAARKLLELALSAGGHDNVGVEMARLISPPDTIASQKPENQHTAAKWLLSAFLLTVVGLYVLAYFLLWRN